jgi:hypothetical protein
MGGGGGAKGIDLVRPRAGAGEVVERRRSGPFPQCGSDGGALMTATQAGEIHARRRILERFGLRLSKRSIDRLVCDIRGGRAIRLKRQSVSRTIYAVRLEYHDQWLPVVYSRVRKSIVTVLPESVLGQYARSAAPQPPALPALPALQDASPQPAAQAEPPSASAPRPPRPPRPPRVIPDTPQWSLEVAAPPTACAMWLTLHFYDRKLKVRVMRRLDDPSTLSYVDCGGHTLTHWAAAERVIRKQIATLMQGEREVHLNEALGAQACEILLFAIVNKGITEEYAPPLPVSPPPPLAQAA